LAKIKRDQVARGEAQRSPHQQRYQY